MYRTIAGISALVLAVVSSAAVGAGNRVPNPGFERGLDGWTTGETAQYEIDQSVKRSGRASARITVPDGVELKYQKISVDVSVKPGETWAGCFWVLSKPNADGSGPYGAMEFLKNGERVGIAHTDFRASRNEPDAWHMLQVKSAVPAGADTARLSLIMHAHGTAWFDDVEVARVAPAPKPDRREVRLTLRPDRLITDRWQGFGCQGDIFLYSSRTIRQGMNNEDRRLIRHRIQEMRPKLVRLAANLNDWERERGVTTPDAEPIIDLRRTLEIYKSVGADIQLTEWGQGTPDWTRPTNGMPHPDERRAFVDSWVSLVKYLRQDCGLTNVRYVTLYNEPNTNPWEFTRALYKDLDASLRAAGLRDAVKIIGPDEACENQLLPLAIRDIDGVIDFYDAHNYTGNTGPEFGLWTSTRIDMMPKTSQRDASPARKRFLITEFGMCDGMDTWQTPHNGEYDYGVFLADSAIVACNEGVSGMSMWCIGDTDYGHRMKWGLWKFRDEGWEPRPGFYAWSLITRYTDLGSDVCRLESDSYNAPAVAFRAPVNGLWTLMAVNRLEMARPVTLSGLPAGSKWTPYVYSKESVPTPDREMIRAGETLEATADGTLRTTLPSRSFVLWRQAR